MVRDIIENFQRGCSRNVRLYVGDSGKFGFIVHFVCGAPRLYVLCAALRDCMSCVRHFAIVCLVCGAPRLYVLCAAFRGRFIKRNSNGGQGSSGRLIKLLGPYNIGADIV